MGYSVVAGSSCGSRGRTRTSSTGMAGMSGLPDLGEHAADDGEFAGVEGMDEAVSHGLEVQRGGGDQLGHAALGEHGLLAAAVVGARLLADQAALDHGGDLVGE